MHYLYEMGATFFRDLRNFGLNTSIDIWNLSQEKKLRWWITNKILNIHVATEFGFRFIRKMLWDALLAIGFGKNNWKRWFHLQCWFYELKDSLFISKSIFGKWKVFLKVMSGRWHGNDYLFQKHVSSTSYVWSFD